MTAKCTVINIRRRKTNDPYYRYIGRGSPLGNPFEIWGGGRDWACEQFAAWAPTQPKVMAEIANIKPGTVLGCFCKPSRCHGDWIAEQVNKREGATD